jgi:ubiquinone/menaquinone biosynthesis C-methylase UbiE
VSLSDRIHYASIAFMHETLYGLFWDPYKPLRAAGLQPGQRVLEVGCGPGFFTIPAGKIVGEGGSVCALDINPVAVERVRRKVAAQGITNIDVTCSDAAHTGLPEHSFDLAFVFGLGHAAGGLEGIWAELHRLLKPEGTLAIEGRVRPPEALFFQLATEGRVARFARRGDSTI